MRVGAPIDVADRRGQHDRRYRRPIMPSVEPGRVTPVGRDALIPGLVAPSLSQFHLWAT